MKKVFLTGASGFLGERILKKLEDEKVTTVCYTRKKFLNKDKYPNAVSVIGELHDYRKIRKAMRGCDSIIHCAGLVDFDQKNYKQLHFIHVEALRNLIKASKGTKVKRLVYISSHWTIGFSLSQNIVCTESSSLHPDNKIYNPYQQTKFEGEKFLSQNGNLGIKYIIVNPTQIWGVGNKNKQVLRFINKAKTRRLFIVPHGGLNIVHVNDVAQGIFLALKYGKPGERYILSGENITFKSLVAKFLQIRNKRGVVIELPGSPTRFLTKLIYNMLDKLFPALLAKFHFLNSIVSFKYYSSKKAKSELGYTNSMNINAIIKEIMGVFVV